jgi:hypothetical protein
MIGKSKFQRMYTLGHRGPKCYKTDNTIHCYSGMSSASIASL